MDDELYAQALAIKNYLADLLEEKAYHLMPADAGVQALKQDVGKAITQLEDLLAQLL